MNRIAIVDDSEINLTLLKHLVLKLGDCEPLLFSDSPQGLAWCAGNDPDLIIVDYMMPELDGISFIERLRAVPGHEELPILMITANDDKEVRYEALARGATDFLTKPVDTAEFRARVRNMLALRASQRRLSNRNQELAEEVRLATAEIHAREQELLFRMSRAAEFRDPETGAHIQRMAHYSALIAGRLGLDAATQELLLQAAPMHDVGKIGIPDYILLKPGRLTPEEFELMKNHARLGYELLHGSSSRILQAGAEIALAHHEKFDGSGYPQNLVGEAIPLFGRIVAVADVFDALTSERPYKKAWDLDRAALFLKVNCGSHFDPACVEAFFAAWDEALAIRERFHDEEVPLL
ncbi:HD domain-containing phosphohydrolase [Azospira restricta]|uniref:Response regulator n=1 Tax=Azospira restricta TaxID=404405 RepID=A0A974PWF6_9RHOO|nr:HD domain-containing phosphohydrolase [Azospira restricta]QRJ62225.1 response regulator [Azospira restricta]